MTSNVIAAGHRFGRKRRPKSLEPEHLEYLREHGFTDDSYIKRSGLQSKRRGLRINYPKFNGGPRRDGFNRVRLLPEYADAKFMQDKDTTNHLYLALINGGPSWEEIAENIETDIVWCEGELKAAVLAQHGIVALAAGGVFGWLYHPIPNHASRPLRELRRINFEGRKVSILWDSDIRTNYNVQCALIRLATYLQTRGAIVTVRIIEPAADGTKRDINDVVAAKGIKGFHRLAQKALDDSFFADFGIPQQPKATDTGNGQRFASRHADTARYVNEWDAWLIWCTQRWERDRTEVVRSLARGTAREIHREALQAKEDARRKELAAWAIRSEDTARITSMLREGRSFPPLAISASQLDTHPMLLQVENGVVDLKAGQLLPTVQEWLLTKRSPVAFNADAQCPIFERVVSEIMGGDKGLVEYLRRCVGYLLTGDTREQCFFIWYGTGSNGKTTLLNIVRDLLGEYAIASRMETWAIHTRAGSGASEDLARLQGARMVSAVESEEHHRLSEALVKEVTGQDQIAARRLYQNSFEFIPQFKLILVCNHKPIIRGDDPAIWRRVRLVPFEQAFQGKADDKGLKDKLRAELPGILNWAVEGARGWLKHGLAEPKPIRRATQDYKRSSDVLGDFVREECIKERGASVASSHLYHDYCEWAKRSGYQPMSIKSFSNRMQDRGFKIKKGKSHNLFSGLRQMTTTEHREADDALDRRIEGKRNDQ